MSDLQKVSHWNLLFKLQYKALSLVVGVIYSLVRACALGF